MYQIIHTIYQTDELSLQKVQNGQVPMICLKIKKKIDLIPLAQYGGICLKLLNDLGAKIEITNTRIVLIEDAKIMQNQTELYFIGELLVLKEKNIDLLKQYLILLYKAYSILLKHNKQLDFSLYNLYIVQDQIKVFDIGMFTNNKSQNKTNVNKLGLLLAKLFLSRQEFQPLKYMNEDQQSEYIKQFEGFQVLFPLFRFGAQALSWEQLGQELFCDDESNQNTINTTIYYKKQLQTLNSISQYNIAVQRIQSNLRSRSRRNIYSIYENNRVQSHSQESDFNDAQTIKNLRQRRTINPNTQIIRPGSISSTPNNKTENGIRQTPQRLSACLKTENYQKDDSFQPKINILSPSDSIQNFTTLSTLNQKIQLYDESVTYQNNQEVEHLTLKSMNEKTENNKRLFKMPQHVLIPSKDNNSTLQTIILKDDLTKELQSYYDKYKHSFECLNMIGSTVAKCIIVLDAKKTLWMMPLFVIFKRMYQLRKQLIDDLKKNKNIWKLKYFQEFIDDQIYKTLIEEYEKQNEIVENEVKILLTNCEEKYPKLEQKNQAKIQPLLNLNWDQNIKDVAFIYFFQQIYSQIKRLMVEKPKIAQQMRDLLVRIQCSLIIMSQAPYTEFDLQEYNLRKQDEQYRQENDAKLETLKQQIQGYTL